MTSNIQMLEAVVCALNGIEVKGEKNLDALLGCIQTIKQVHDALLPKENACDEVGDEDG